ITARHMSGAHHGKPNGAMRVNEARAASTASMARMGNSAATRVGTCGLTAGEERRRAAIRAAIPTWALSRLPSTPMLDARYRIRRGTVPPAASMLRCQASLRASRATIWSRTATRSTQAAALERASANSCRLPSSTKPRTTSVTSEPTTVIGVRRRRPKSRRVAPNWASRRVIESMRTEREGFEPSRQVDPPTRFPVALLKPLGHLSGVGERLVPRGLDARQPPEGPEAQRHGLGPEALAHVRRRRHRHYALDGHGLSLCVLADAHRAVAPAQAGVLHPAHGGVHRPPGRDVALIDVHRPCLEPLRKAPAPA